MNPPGSGHAYVDVDDVDALFAEMEPRLRGLAGDRWGGPCDQHYGQREYWVRDPDRNLIHFGEGVGEKFAQWDYRKPR